MTSLVGLMSFSYTLLEELQLPSGIATLGERTKQTLGDTSTVNQYSFSGGSAVASLVVLARQTPSYAKATVTHR